MTDKERLEEIKRQLEESNSYDDNPNGYWYRNINWLIQQAERVQDLEELIEDYKTVNKELHDRRKKLRKQNKRLLEKVDYLLKKEGEAKDVIQKINQVCIDYERRHDPN